MNRPDGNKATQSLSADTLEYRQLVSRDPLDPKDILINDAIHTDEAHRNKDLEQMLSSSWFDAIDLSTSPAFERKHALPRLAESIVQARRASLNPKIAVVVGGRVFFEHPDEDVGADINSASAEHVEKMILQELHKDVE